MTNKLLLVFLFFGLIVLFSFKRDKTKKVVFFGDSITQAGVAPNGYITMIKDMLQKEGDNSYDLIGAGIGGNKVYDLYLRLEDDVLSKSPDIVVIYIGVNDVWHKASSGTGTDADKFEKFYRAIIKKLQAANAKVILVTPAVIGERKNYMNQQDGDLNKYASIIKSISNSLIIPVVDLRTLFENYEQEHNTDDVDKGVLTLDGVHLNDAGNKLVAEAILKEIKDVK
jgi:lysophospholipase L1-like esterase